MLKEMRGRLQEWQEIITRDARSRMIEERGKEEKTTEGSGRRSKKGRDAGKKGMAALIKGVPQFFVRVGFQHFVCGWRSHFCKVFRPLQNSRMCLNSSK
jgi:hypothetical protein